MFRHMLGEWVRNSAGQMTKFQIRAAKALGPETGSQCLGMQTSFWRLSEIWEYMGKNLEVTWHCDYLLKEGIGFLGRPYD